MAELPTAREAMVRAHEALLAAEASAEADGMPSEVDSLTALGTAWMMFASELREGSTPGPIIPMPTRSGDDEFLRNVRKAMVQAEERKLQAAAEAAEAAWAEVDNWSMCRAMGTRRCPTAEGCNASAPCARFDSDDERVWRQSEPAVDQQLTRYLRTADDTQVQPSPPGMHCRWCGIAIIWHHLPHLPAPVWLHRSNYQELCSITRQDGSHTLAEPELIKGEE